MATAKEKLTALADAVREKTGETSPLSLDAMTSLIMTLGSGSGLPVGITMGEFVTTEETKNGGFSIEHGLGKMPNYVFIWSSDINLQSFCFRTVMKANLYETFDEESGETYPEAEARYGLSDTVVTFRNQPCTISYYDDKNVFWLPDATSRFYRPGIPYKWIAIRIEE